MKTVFIALSVFTLVICISSADANEVEMKLPINFLDLPAELRMEIFDYVDWKDLIRVRKTFPQDRDSIERVFRTMFRDTHTFLVFVSGEFRAINIFYGPVTIAADVKETSEHFQQVLDFLQYFGHCISKLEVGYNSYNDGKLLEPFQKQIRKYVVESVDEVELYLKNSPINRTLSDLVVPFSKCKIVKIRNTEIDAATLHHMFPAVCNLNIELIQMEESLEQFQHLEDLIIPNGWGASQSYLPVFEKTLELNPQLKHISIRNCSHWNFIRTLNEIRPAIESLEIANLNLDDHESAADSEPLHFTNVKLLTIELSSGRAFANGIPLAFGNLEEIEFELSDFADHWTNLMVQNKKLKRITAKNGLRRVNLQRIANGLPNLEEFTMRYDDTDTKAVEDIVDFLQNAKQLKTARFLRLGSNECEAATHQLNDEWNNTASNSYLCCFVRKEV